MEVVSGLLEQNIVPGKAVRLLGVSAGALQSSGWQESLLDGDKRKSWDRLYRAIDRLKESLSVSLDRETDIVLLVVSASQPELAEAIATRLDATHQAVQIVGEPEPEEDGLSSSELIRLNNELATMARERGRRERELERVLSMGSGRVVTL